MYEQSKHLIAVSALVKNENGHVLMVRTHLRSDTWEMPGGFVDAGEPLDIAVCREFLEETGVVIRPLGISESTTMKGFMFCLWFLMRNMLVVK